MKRLYGGVLLLMAGIAAVSIGITALLGQYRTRREDGFAVMASFYPMYTAALQVAGGIDGVTVSCLTQPQTGCLHDYQLSPGEMIALKEADILVLNGAGAEAFLSSALAQLPDLRVADTSEGIPLLEGQGHTHEHDGSETAEEHAHAVNEHIWMSPARYARQVENLRDALAEADPAHAAAYRANAERYLAQVREMEVRASRLSQALAGRDCATFHDSAAYLAADLSLHVTAALSIGEESGASAGELAAAADALRGRDVLLLYDGQYPGEYAYLADYASSSRTVVLDTAVKPSTGADPAVRWLDAMESNLRALENGG